MGEGLPRVSDGLTDPKVTAFTEFLSYQCQNGKIREGLLQSSAVQCSEGGAYYCSSGGHSIYLELLLIAISLVNLQVKWLAAIYEPWRVKTMCFLKIGITRSVTCWWQWQIHVSHLRVLWGTLIVQNGGWNGRHYLNDIFGLSPSSVESWIYISNICNSTDEKQNPTVCTVWLGGGFLDFFFLQFG